MKLNLVVKAVGKKEIAIRLYKLRLKFNWHIGTIKDKHGYLGHSKMRACFYLLKIQLLYYC